MENLNRRYQLFTEQGTDPAGQDPGTDPNEGNDNEGKEKEVYSKEEVTKLLAEQKEQMGKDFDDKFNKKFAKFKADAEKEKDEAAKLAEMSAQEKAEHERDKLQKELNELKAKDNLNSMTLQARTLLAEKDIQVDDKLLAVLVSPDAEKTKESVEAFIELFETEVEKQVKAKLAGGPPKAGKEGSSTLTKAEIMAIQDPVERQKKIAENMNLFRKE